MWKFIVIVLFTAPILLTSADDMTSRTGFSDNRPSRSSRKGEIPLLLIRPVQRPSFASLLRGLTSSKPTPVKVEAQQDDMNILGNILPQLGLDPSMFSAYPMGSKPTPQKMHIIPVQSNEIKHGPNFKTEYHLTIKETPSFGKHSFFSHPAPPPPKFQHSFDHSGHFVPSKEIPHISEEGEKHEEHHQFESHAFHEAPQPDSHHIIESGHFEPKPIDFESITSKEELVIGKPSASHPSPHSFHSTHEFKIPDGPETQFYIPKGEDTASFEVKSKTENVQFVPENHDEFPLEEFKHDELHHEGPPPPPEELHIESPGKNEYLPTGKPFYHSLFNTSPKFEYYQPHELETATIKGFSEDLYKNFDTEEYFLPKKEPDFHKMMGDSLFNPPKVPHASSLQSGYPFDDSYSFRIKGNSFGKIHITDHVYHEPQALRYHHKTPEFPNSFFPSISHKDIESKIPSHEFGKYPAFPTNSEPPKNYISSTYKDGEVKNETNPNYEPPTYDEKKEATTEKESELKFTFEPSTYDFKTFTPSSIGHHEFKDYFKSNEHHSFYPHHPPSPIFKPFAKTSYGKPIFESHQDDHIRPVFETHHDERTTAPPKFSDYKNEYQPKPIKLYLSERENASVPINEIPLPSTTTPYPFNFGSTSKFELKFPSKKFTTPKITTYKQKLLPVNQSTTKSLETTTENVTLLSGIACERQCIRNTVSQEYDPVCGSDGKTYSNKGKLRCTRTCGKSDLAVRHYGGCGRNEQNNS